MASIQRDGIGPEKGTKNIKQWYKKLGKLKKKKIQNDPFKNLLVIESPQSLLFNHANREKILSGQLLGHVFDIVDSSLVFKKEKIRENKKKTYCKKKKNCENDNEPWVEESCPKQLVIWFCWIG